MLNLGLKTQSSDCLFSRNVTKIHFAFREYSRNVTPSIFVSVPILYSLLFPSAVILLMFYAIMWLHVQICDQKRTLSKLLRRRVSFVPRSVPVVLALSVEATNSGVDRREPRLLKGTVAGHAVVTPLSTVDIVWDLLVPCLFLLRKPTSVGLTPLDCLSALIFFSKYVNKSDYIIKIQPNVKSRTLQE